MSSIERNEENNSVVFSIEDPAGYSAFKMFNTSGDSRQLDRHEETRELKDVINSNFKHSQIVVKFGDTYLPLKNR